MKIVVAVRTRNEERNIANFCQAYGFADLILVADGGSEDRTLAIASRFPNVVIRGFPEKLPRGNAWANPHDEHYDFLFGWAMNENPDWIITDDCDCRPNKLLREDARKLLETTACPLVYAVRLYIWGADNLREEIEEQTEADNLGEKTVPQHFPQLARPGIDREWAMSLWAFRRESPIRAKPGDPWEHFRGFDIPDLPKFNVMPPYCLLHFPWPDEEAVEHKRRFYELTGWVPNMLHPLEFGGPLKSCPEWASE